MSDNLTDRQRQLLADRLFEAAIALAQVVADGGDEFSVQAGHAAADLARAYNVIAGAGR